MAKVAVRKKMEKTQKTDHKDDLYLRPTSPEAMQTAIKIHKRACVLDVSDFVDSFTV